MKHFLMHLKLRVIFFALITLGSGFSVQAETQPQCRNILVQSFQETQSAKVVSYRQTLKRLKSLGKSLDEAETLSTQEERRRFARIVWKALKTSEGDLSSEELDFVNSRVWFKSIFKSSLLLGLQNTYALKALVGFFNYVRAEESQFHWFKAPTWGGKLVQLLRSIYNVPIRALFPGHLPQWRTDTNKIFERQWNTPSNRLLQSPVSSIKKRFFDKDPSPDFEASPADLDTLEKSNALQLFVNKKEFMERRPTWSRLRRLLGRTAIALSLVNSLAVVNHGMQMHSGDVISYETFDTSPQYELADNQVRLYNESVPFPHMAIQIGDRVYSYGQTHMTVISTFEYLQSKSIVEAQRLYRENNNITIPEPVYDNSSQMIKGKLGAEIGKRIRLDKLPRSVEMTTLNLNEQEVQRLQRQLELHTAKRYRNQTLVVDCATMIVDALKRSTNVSIPGIIDPSPSLIMMYLSSLKTLNTKNNDGDNLVEQVFVTATEEPERVKMHLIRDAYINALEGKIYIYMAPFTAVHRSYMEVRYGSEDWQFWDPEVKTEIESWSGLIKEEIENQTDFVFVEVLKQKANEARISDDPVAKADSRQAIEGMFSLLTHPEEQMLQSGQSSFWDVMRSGYKLNYYKKYKDYLLDLLETESPNEFEGHAISFEELLKLSEEFI